MLRDDDDCEKVLNDFALATANYTFCAIRFARPIKLCQFCVGKYLNVESIHNDILTVEDEAGDKCKEKLMNLDRLQVVEAGFDYTTGLWKRASCDSCFVLDDQGNPTKELNSNTKEILRLSNETQTCINEHWNKTSLLGKDPEVCTICKSSYLELNSRYDTLKCQGFCMDIVDLMNSTRAQWSSELGCCLDRKQPEWVFLVSSLVFSCLPLAFYLAAFMFTTRKQQTILKQRRLQENWPSTSTMMSPD